MSVRRLFWFVFLYLAGLCAMAAGAFALRYILAL